MKYSFSFILLSCLLIGCSQSNDLAPAQAVSDTDETSSVSAGSDDTASDVALKLINANQYAAELASREGKVLLVDMWATW